MYIYAKIAEILPLVEFELEENISDEEAEKLINDSLSSSDDITTTNQFSVTSEIDLFTARLMKYEVFSYFEIRGIRVYM